LNNFVVMS